MFKYTSMIDMFVVAHAGRDGRDGRRGIQGPVGPAGPKGMKIHENITNKNMAVTHQYLLIITIS